jgi:hypothetical protein
VLQMAQAVTAWPIATELKRLWHLLGWWRPVWYRPNPWHGRNLSDPERPLSRLKLRFSTAWDEALERGLDALEDEVMRRAKDGVAEPVYYQGRVVAGRISARSARVDALDRRGREPRKIASIATYRNANGSSPSMPSL